MANKLAVITLGNRRFYELDANPSVGGYAANLGDIALAAGKMYIKSGPLDVNWTQMAEASQLDSYILSSEKGIANGVATLNADGKLALDQIPAIAITDTFVVNSEAAMLALTTAEQGDVAVRTDINKSFILTNSNPSVLASWQELLTPTDAVQSVNGQTGTVVLSTSNIGEGSNLYFTEARVRGTLLDGLTLVDSPILATDSMIQAMGKIQGQINSIESDLLRDGGFASTPSDNGTFNASAANRKIVVTTAGGGLGKVIVLPVTTSLPSGLKYEIYNFSEEGTVEVRKADGVTVVASLTQGQKADIVLTVPASATYAPAYITYLRLGTTAAMNAGELKIINMADPTQAKDAMTLGYAEANYWKNASSLAGLYDALVDRYFGTKSGDFDIIFARNNVEQFKMKTDMLEFKAGYELKGLGQMVISAIGSLYRKSQSDIEELKDSSDVLISRMGRIAKRPVVADLDATKDIEFASFSNAKDRVISVKAMFSCVEGNVASWMKTIHVDKSGNVILTQDDFTSKNTGAAGVDLVVVSFASNVLTVRFSGMGSMTEKLCHVIFEEEAAL